MDNFRLYAIARPKEALGDLLKLAFSRFRSASHYSFTEKVMVFYWSIPTDGPCFGDKALSYYPLPSAIGYEKASDLAWDWLENTAVRCRQPDHDGDNKPAFLVSTEDWGRAGGSAYGICQIEPAWAMYGK